MRNYILSLLLLFAISSASNAQTVTPDSLLDGSPPMTIPKSESNENDEKDKVEEEKLPDLPGYDETGWIAHQRLLQCHSMSNVRNYTLARGQIIVLSGFKAPNYVPSDPFEGMIITKNPNTNEYTLLLVQVSTGLTCIVQMGSSIQSTNDIIKQLEENLLEEQESTEK